MASSIASSDEFIRFVKETLPDQGPSEATSRRMGSDPILSPGRQRRRLRQAVAAARRLIDEEDVKHKGVEMGKRDEKEEDDVGEGSEVGGREKKDPLLMSRRGRPPIRLWIGVLYLEEI
ncbi:UNVERIFIED_CONTAM: hypothetical protein Sradi_0158000 [Sesamum radiatum]|uniref:Uncharacterized protein n=1 Tax=Sesamum radiatum TaxID=300843 RepID=A0AAW2WLT8_SESRA